MGGVSTTTSVEALVGVELVQLLGRHVLLRAGQRAGDVPIERVALDPLGLLRVGRVQLDQVVEGHLGVEHGRPELPCAGRVGSGHQRRLVGESARGPEAERVGEATGGIDGDDDRPPPLLGRLGGQDRGGGGLADTARAAADDDAALGHDPRQRLAGRPLVPGRPVGHAASALDLVEQPIGERLDVARSSARP